MAPRREPSSGVYISATFFPEPPLAGSTPSDPPTISCQEKDDEGGKGCRAVTRLHHEEVGVEGTQCTFASPLTVLTMGSLHTAASRGQQQPPMLQTPLCPTCQWQTQHPRHSTSQPRPPLRSWPRWLPAQAACLHGSHIRDGATHRPTQASRLLSSPLRDITVPQDALTHHRHRPATPILPSPCHCQNQDGATHRPLPTPSRSRSPSLASLGQSGASRGVTGAWRKTLKPPTHLPSLAHRSLVLPANTPAIGTVPPIDRLHLLILADLVSTPTPPAAAPPS